MAEGKAVDMLPWPWVSMHAAGAWASSTVPSQFLGPPACPWLSEYMPSSLSKDSWQEDASLYACVPVLYNPASVPPAGNHRSALWN